MNGFFDLYLYGLPEAWLGLWLVLVLLMDLFFGKRFPDISYHFSLVGLVIAIGLLIPALYYFQLPLLTFSGQYAIDRLAIISKLFIYMFSLWGVIYARDYLKSRNFLVAEFYVLMLLAVLGMSVMASAYTFLTLFLGLELLSLCLYAMIAMDKKDDAQTGLAYEAAMKYFVVGSLATGFLLYGVSLLYGATGYIEFNEIARHLPLLQQPMVILGFIFVLCALIFKLGAVPFHMWVPDVYQGAGSPVTLFMSGAPKIAGFAILLRVLIEALPNLQSQWVQILIVIAILSMFAGNLLAIAQTDIKRMFAYSSIAHVGYTLLGLIAGPYSVLGYSAALFYIGTYALAAVGGFAVITILSRHGVELSHVDDYRGLNARNPWLAFMMLLILFSMAGIPPVAGFFAKLGVLEALVQAKFVWLAVLALLFALIGVYYYLRVVMVMYFQEPNENAAHFVTLSPSLWWLISINGLLVLWIGIMPSYFIDLCRLTIR